MSRGPWVELTGVVVVALISLMLISLKGSSVVASVSMPRPPLVPLHQAGKVLELIGEAGTVWAGLLKPPATEPYNLPDNFAAKPTYHSQVGQDRWVDGVFHQKTGLFVLESGANDGWSHSNSLFFEVGRSWECLLVEANPELAAPVLGLHRKCRFFGGGLSITDKPSSFDFMLAGPLGGIVSEMDTTRTRAEHEIQSEQPWMAGKQGNGTIVQVKCFPLHMILEKLGRTVVDYWSLDTEGSELKILKATDFSKIEVGVITVEHQGNPAAQRGIFEELTTKGFKRVVSGGQDDYYASPKYFQNRGWDFPA